VTGGRATEGERRRPLVPILLFVLGFTLVFTLLGAFAGALVGFVRDPWFQGVAGLVVTLLGVLMIGFALWRGSPALGAERRGCWSGCARSPGSGDATGRSRRSPAYSSSRPASC
jgi:cytochrome c biogenesis protein CcdA